MSVATIEDLLHRRTDLSTFLVHLTRASGEESSRENVLAMAKHGRIEARSAFGPAAGFDVHLGTSTATQKVVCVTETPLEHTWMMLQDIEGRRVQFEPYGIAITKTTARRANFNPVWYSDISAHGRDWPMIAINRLIDDAKDRCTGDDGTIDADALRDEPIFSVTPFIEQMGPINNGYRRKEFWWEREWRHIGDYRIDDPARIVALFAPEDDHVAFRTDLKETNEPWSRRPILDPRWGLERMIAELASIAPDEIGPFPTV